jgi:SAM-dependent methyltransferase
MLEMRFGGDAAAREQDLAGFLYPVRDAVLDRARLEPGQTLLDVGTGDGLIAFGALERLGPAGRVIFSDISQDLLDHCRAAGASVDAVTTRSVLIYVKDKAQAMREFFRVLPIPWSTSTTGTWCAMPGMPGSARSAWNCGSA